MNHFDVEKYAKEVFADFRIAPDEKSWDTISEKLKFAARQKRKKKQLRLGIAVCTLFLISIFQLNPYQVIYSLPKIAKTNKDVEKKREIKLLSTNDLIYPISSINKKEEKKTGVAKSTKTSKILSSEKRAESELLWEKFQGNTSISVPVEKKSLAIVSKKETDSLLQIAQEHLQLQEHLILEQNRKSLAYDILEDLNNEKVTEEESSLLENLKHNYSKFKEIIAN